MNDTYECSYVEVLEILNHIPKEDYEKIPKEKINFYKENIDKNYKYVYNVKSPQTLRKTDAIIVNLYKNYIVTKSQKEQIESILKINSKKSEIEKRKLYNPDTLFNKKTINKEQKIMQIVPKEKWYKKIYNYLKRKYEK